MSRRRRRKLLVVLLVVAVAFVIVFWGWSSTGRDFLGVGTLVDDTYAVDPPAIPSKYLARTIEVQGNVADWYSGANFTLVDKADPSKSIAVHMLGAFPEGFEIGKTVVVKGTLDSTLPLTMQATEITVGCASKY
jgi:cytochrome c-type biogenesis protein CcmE